MIETQFPLFFPKANMKYRAHLLFLAVVSSVAFLSSPNSALAQVSKVEVKRAGDSWQLLRNGQPYYINGAGCDGPIGDLDKYGANSIRTWHYRDDTKSILDEAHAKGMTVTVGIWLGHERHGVNYQDYDSMSKQIDSVLKCVNQFKDHPAVLMWGIGNEMEGEGANPAVWSHIEHLANSVKKIDPNHPTMTVIAEIGGKKIEAIHKFCPSLDVIGVNSYGGAPSVCKRYRELDGTKPIVITEFGPIGTWEVGKNSIDAILEAPSHEKAAFYSQAYSSFKADTQTCLGSYAFLWGHKQEATATWFGMLLPNGKRTAAVDTMSEFWSGKKRANLCPRIESCVLEGSNEVDKNSMVKIKLSATDPENDPLNVEWILTDESSNYVTGGDLQATPKSYKDLIVRSDLNGAEIKMPDSGGLYRIYAYVDDGPNNGGAVANIPIRVKGSANVEAGAKANLPLVVYDETFDGGLFAPSGYMGSTESLVLNPDCEIDPKVGKRCLKVTYSRGDNWAGVVWQNPPEDWGELKGGFDIRGATKMTFWAKGKKGGEEVTFGVGVIGREMPFFDTTKKEIKVKLKETWEQHTIDLSGEDLQRIKSGFFFSLAGQGAVSEFFLDDIKFEGDGSSPEPEAGSDSAKMDSDVADAGKKVDLPLMVYDETFEGGLFAPSGYMGSTESLVLDPVCATNPKVGKHCLKVTYNRVDEWAGVVWQNPPDDWGDQKGGFDIRGATKLTFWARGKKGGEVVNIGVGAIGKDKPFFDSAKKELKVTLKETWEQHTVDLTGSELYRIKSGFLFSLAGQGASTEFYLDEIKFE